MPVTWKLYDGSVLQSLADWRIENPVVNRANLGVETFTFSIPQSDIYAPPTFAYGQRLVLYRDDGTPRVWFIGKVTKLPAFAGVQERQRYVVSNAWYDLQRIVYQQRYMVPNPSGLGLLGSWSTRAVLGQDRWGKAQASHAVIADIASFANSVGGGLATVSSLPTMAVPPVEAVRDISCAEAIRRMAAYTPDAVGYFVYDSGTPVLAIVQRAALTPVTIDLSAKDTIEVIDGINPLYERKLNGVVLIFQKNEASFDGTIKIKEYRQVAGLAYGAGVIFATIQLGDNEAVPSGLASQYYNSLATLEWEASIRIHEQDVSGQLRPGYKLNLSNGRAEWAAMNATVQSTTEELLTGVTSVQIGSADHLGLTDFVDMMRRWRDRNARTNFADTQHNGTEGSDSQADGTDPSPDGDLGPPGPDPDAEDPAPNPNAGTPPIYPTIDLTACIGGVDKTVRVIGYTITGGGGPPPPL